MKLKQIDLKMNDGGVYSLPIDNNTKVEISAYDVVYTVFNADKLTREELEYYMHPTQYYMSDIKEIKQIF